MNLDILNFAAIPFGIEAYNRNLTQSFEKTSRHFVIAFPQHIIAASVASTFFNHYLSWGLFCGLPLSFLAIVIYSERKTNLGKIGDMGSHLARLASKAMILGAVLNSIHVSSSFKCIQTVYIVRACACCYFVMRDAALTVKYATSIVMSFDSILLINKDKSTWEIFSNTWSQIKKNFTNKESPTPSTN